MSNQGWESRVVRECFVHSEIPIENIGRLEGWKVSGLGVWNPYRKPRSQVWEDRGVKCSVLAIPKSL